MVSVSVNTNCRTGPSANYDLNGSLNVGQTAEVIGKNSPSGYWIIKTTGGVGYCWLWGEYATVSGNTANLPEYPVPPTPTPPPTATLAPPAPVSNVSVTKICPFINPQFQYVGVLNWTDQSDNEKGFNIYINGSLTTTLGPGATSYPIGMGVLPPGVIFKLGVEAYNDAGKAATKEANFTCP